MTEAELTNAIIDSLNEIPGVEVWRNNTGRRGRISFGRKGQADITGAVAGGRRVELEVKLPGNNHFEPDQRAFIQRMQELGVIAGVVRSLDDALLLVTVALPVPATPKNNA